MMSKLITVEGIAENLTKKLTYMDIMINNKAYPSEKKSENKFLKVLAPSTYPVGLFKFSDSTLEFFDEKGASFKTLSLNDIDHVKIGMYRNLVRSAPVMLPVNRYVSDYEIVLAGGGEISILNDSLETINLVSEYLKDRGVKVLDPMNLLSEDLMNLSENEFSRLADGTEYKEPLSLMGGNIRV